MTFPYYEASAPPLLSSVLAYEQPLWSRGGVTVAGGDGAPRILTTGAVIGRRLFGVPVVTAGGGPAGDGAVSGVAAAEESMVGVYALTCVAAADGAVPDRFQVVNPNGVRLSDLLAGVAYDNPHLVAVVAVGAAPWAVGDEIAIAIPAGSGEVTALNPAATDGTQIACGVIAADVTAPIGGAVSGSAILRQAHVHGDGLVWPVGVTSPQKSAAFVHLAACGVFIVEEY
jgi:hypothetical protein